MDQSIKTNPSSEWAVTNALGEEAVQITPNQPMKSTRALGEEDDSFEVTTYAIGEEESSIEINPPMTTMALGEEDDGGMAVDEPVAMATICVTMACYGIYKKIMNTSTKKNDDDHS